MIEFMDVSKSSSSSSLVYCFLYTDDPTSDKDRLFSSPMKRFMESVDGIKYTVGDAAHGKTIMHPLSSSLKP